MNKIAYTYSVVRYAHDTGTGESLNIGVILYSREMRWLRFKFEPRFKRLSDAFSGFDGDQHRRALRQFESALELLWHELSDGLPGLYDLPVDAATLAARVWTDAELSFRIGPSFAGLTDDPDKALESLFARMVLDQYDRPTVRSRTDEEVWAKYALPLPIPVKRVICEKIFEADDYELQFPHAFKNGLWHLLQPVTLDYSRSGEIQDKVARWLGRAALLRDNPEVAKLYLLLGAPRDEGHALAYARAKSILHRMPLSHQIVEENEAADFALFLQDYMRKHGVLPSEEAETEKQSNITRK